MADIIVVADISESDDLDAIDEKVAAAHDGGTVGGCGDTPTLATAFDEASGDLVGKLQSLRVHIYEGELAVIQTINQQDVGHELTRDDGATSAEYGYFWHGAIAFFAIA